MARLHAWKLRGVAALPCLCETDIGSQTPCFNVPRGRSLELAEDGKEGGARMARFNSDVAVYTSGKTTATQLAARRF
jgi:hypothetical protein